MFSHRTQTQAFNVARPITSPFPDQVELEFVQCLSNPHYLHFLAQRPFFRDTAFLNYLEYLEVRYT